MMGIEQQQMGLVEMVKLMELLIKQLGLGLVELLRMVMGRMKPMMVMVMGQSHWLVR
jgi:hypothetical protein